MFLQYRMNERGNKAGPDEGGERSRRAMSHSVEERGKNHGGGGRPCWRVKEDQGTRWVKVLFTGIKKASSSTSKKKERDKTKGAGPYLTDRETRKASARELPSGAVVVMERTPSGVLLRIEKLRGPEDPQW